MGQRGPTPLPPNVHRLRGNASHKPLSSLLDDIVRPDVAIPTPPDHLEGEALAEWNRITPHLEKLGLVSEIDRAALVGYCDSWSEYVWACERIKQMSDRRDDKGIVIDPNGVAARIWQTPSGYKQISVIVQIKNRALEMLVKFLAEFGMSPAARSRVTASDPQLGLPGLDNKPEEGGWGAFKNKG